VEKREIAAVAAETLLAGGDQTLSFCRINAGFDASGANLLDRGTRFQFGMNRLDHPLGGCQGRFLDNRPIKRITTMATPDIVAVMLCLEQGDEVQGEVGGHPHEFVLLFRAASDAVKATRSLLCLALHGTPDE
jgi:hypothetical protein